MKPLIKQPDHSAYTGQEVNALLPKLRLKEVEAFLAKANGEYYHWEDVRRRPQPAGLTSAQTWYLIKISRANRHSLELLDVAGRPYSYWLPDEAQQTLHVIDRQSGATLGPDIDRVDTFEEMKVRIMIDSLMEEAIATSKIEGAITTRKVAKEMLRTGRSPRDRSEHMIANGYATAKLLRAQRDRPLSVEFLHEIQSSITRNTLDNPKDAGRFRREEDGIHIVDERDNEVIYVPPPAADLGPRIKKLIAFANRPDTVTPFIHPLVKASILHFWLAYEHPYVDGNGRTARALFYWSMLRSGYWLFEFLTISRVIYAAPSRYYRSFRYSEHDDNDLTYFLTFQLEVVARSLDQLHKKIREIALEQQRIRSSPAAKGLNPRQRALLDHALTHPGQIYTFDSHQSSHGVTYPTARADILAMFNRGFLMEIGTSRPREFVAARDIDDKLKIGR